MAKKSGVNIATSVLALILGVVSAVALYISSTPGDPITNQLVYIMPAIAAAVALLGIILSVATGTDSFIVTIVNLAALVVLMVAFGYAVSERAVLASAVFTFRATDETAWAAFIPSAVALGGELVGALVLTIGSFCKAKK